MSDPNNPQEPDDMVEEFKRRMLPVMRARMEGRLNPDSPADRHMFDELFDEVLQDEHIVLNFSERQRLYDELMAAF